MSNIAGFQPKLKKHLDGSVCLEGTRLLPKEYKPCCNMFASHTSTCTHDLRYQYSEKFNSWSIALQDGSGIMIKYCPHCASKL